MKSLMVTLGLLAFVSASTQLFRHVYYGWVLRTESVLDAYKEKSEREIAKLKTIDELAAKYDETHQKIKELDKKIKAIETGKSKAELRKLQEEDPAILELHESQSQFLATERDLSSLIADSEKRREEIRQLHYFWWCGMACLGLGLGLFLWAHRWIGIAAMTVGFVEMIYWTSPTFFSSGGLEYERLLFWKLVYTGTTLFLLLALWGFSGRLAKRCA